MVSLDVESARRPGDPSEPPAVGSPLAHTPRVADPRHPELPPGPPQSRPIQTLAWLSRTGPFLERCRERYGDTFTVRIGGEPTWVMVSHPDAIEQVFKGDPRIFHAGEGNQILRPVLGPSSVLLLDEDEHMAHRKLMLPPFHGERMRAYGDLMAEVAATEVRRWPAGEPLELAPRMQAVTLEVIMRAVFGVSEADRLARLRTALRQALDWTFDMRRVFLLAALGPRRIERLGLLRRALAPVDELLLEEIRRRRSDPGVADRDDVMSMLVQARREDGRPMSDAEVRDELVTLLVAGHETTATALSWALERLVRHPDKLERLREEVDAGEDAYLDAVIRETLRLRPVLAIVARRLTEDAEVAGRLLPAGAVVAPCIYLVHR
ncbi:MAG TPA: cytochrome P450, partial [Thermoleophilaceae bacterium]|nr:cytochrome P450 [Thermoleophilaceae bacterium]